MGCVRANAIWASGTESGHITERTTAIPTQAASTSGVAFIDAARREGCGHPRIAVGATAVG